MVVLLAFGKGLPLDVIHQCGVRLLRSLRLVAVIRISLQTVMLGEIENLSSVTSDHLVQLVIKIAAPAWQIE